MTMQDAIALQPAWIGYWLKVLLFGAFILPIVLIIWKQSRVAGILTIVASLAAGFATSRLFDAVGYVKLLGLPHILFWTPLVIYLVTQIRKPDMPKPPRLILIAVTGVILISLAFDYVDLARYLLGEKTPLEGTV